MKLRALPAALHFGWPVIPAILLIPLGILVNFWPGYSNAAMAIGGTIAGLCLLASIPNTVVHLASLDPRADGWRLQWANPRSLRRLRAATKWTIFTLLAVQLLGAVGLVIWIVT